MPKSGRRKKSSKQHDCNKSGSKANTARTADSSSSHSEDIVVDDNPRHGHDHHLPEPFPIDLPRPPKHDFLRNEPPYRESFQAALNGPYRGFVVDNSDDLKKNNNNNDADYDMSTTTTSSSVEEATVQSALHSMLNNNYFRVDVTQPFGLGTKCAKTYVTRCLVGVPGTTYKYLGLRMFAYPFGLNQDTKIIDTLRRTLTDRTRFHLHQLNKQRRQSRSTPVKGRADFDICLINRMVHTPELKSTSAVPSAATSAEDSNDGFSGRARTTVSWHADSSLEHYSTIAVYQTMEDHQSIEENNNDTNGAASSQEHWWVALRVAHYSEGPNASQGRKGSDIDSTIALETPAIAVSLPSGSAYYLLDDFNHHHQHTVLTTANDESTAGVRYSCTFRLLRESHNIEYWIERGRTAIRQFHKKGMKVWKSEQLLLTELESEWIRQFFIQGTGHYDLLWESYWEDPIEQLLDIWSRLEHRTFQIVELLRAAAEAKCGVGLEINGPPDHVSKGDRKEREKRKKALATIDDILARQEGYTDTNESTAITQLYSMMADSLQGRATMRELWAKREKDRVFHDMPPECRPMRVPLRFDQRLNNNEPGTSARKEFGSSPFSDSPDQLKEMAKRLKQLCKAFLEGDPAMLPPSWNHSKAMDWAGWTLLDFALELQQPWAGAVVDGKKTIETRNYKIPPALIGKRVFIIQSSSGQAGISSLGDHVDFPNEARPCDGTSTNQSRVGLIGWCVFKAVKAYTTKESFEADEGLHLVKPDSGYGWKVGKTKTIYGWVVGQCNRFGDKIDTGDWNNASPLNYSSGTRRFRSLFELHRMQDYSNANNTCGNHVTADTNRNSSGKSHDNRSSRKRNKKGKKNNDNASASSNPKNSTNDEKRSKKRRRF